MREGWQYVFAAYGATGATLAVWFWMIGAKLRRVRTSGTRTRGAPDA